jgi:hypothetical protein
LDNYKVYTSTHMENRGKLKKKNEKMKKWKKRTYKLTYLIYFFDHLDIVCFPVALTNVLD